MNGPKPDGGPAFPMPAGPEPKVNWATHFNEGMSLRDYYKAKALQGLCANPGGPFQANGMNGWGIVNCTEDDIAALCEKLADAMLKS